MESRSYPHLDRSVFSRCASGQFTPGVEHTGPRLAGCHLATPLQATTPLSRSGLQHAPACLRCPLLTPAGRSAMIAHRAVPLDSRQTSRGQRSDLLCLDAGLIKYAPWWMEDVMVACPLVPSVPHLSSGACPSPRTCVPRVLQTPPRGDALALRWSFGSTPTWTGDLHPHA